jgi:hypothetical protein
MTMPPDYSKSINPEKARIFRIVHRNNIPWILSDGLHCGNSNILCPDWVHIGSPELIEKRAAHPVPAGPRGCLHDYVPFYFTPFSPMMKNIHSGLGGVKKRPNDEIVILVANLRRIAEQGLEFVFTDCHAFYEWADFYTDLADLDKIDWKILQARDFKRDADDPVKFERYQAEALVYRHCPVSALDGVVCYSESVKSQLENWLMDQNMKMHVHLGKGWYFS